MNTPEILMRKIEQLGPWRYDHEHGDIKIKGDPVAAPIHGDHGYGKATMAHILKVVIKWKKPSEMRVLDLGCLEGHYADQLCEAGFAEVVAIDLSAEQVERARFLLLDLKGHVNVSVLQGSVEDENFMSSLGRFDLILFHGLLYHLKDPIGIFETLSKLATPNNILLLSTQFKFPFAEIVSPSPIANIKFRNLPQDGDKLVRYDGIRSTYASTASRLNPVALYRLLNMFGLPHVVAYDTPLGCTYGFQVNLVACTDASVDLAHMMNTNIKIPGLRFFPWAGDRLDGLSLVSGWRGQISRFALRLAYSICERTASNASRQKRRQEIARYAK